MGKVLLEGARAAFSHRLVRVAAGVLIALFACCVWSPVQPAVATPVGWTTEQLLLSEPDANCLMCHADPDFKGTFLNGDSVSLYVDAGEYEQSVHGPAGLNCVACHTGVNRYPHHAAEQVTCVSCHGEEGGLEDADYETLRVELLYDDRRDMAETINEECRSCHEQEFEVSVDSAHMRVLEGGNPDAPLCIDCHGSHDIATPGQPRAKISAMCGTCHSAVYTTYRTSVHGQALLNESNPDVPTCIECHGVHSVRGPRDVSYRNDSIIICGGCHADKEMMDRYGLSTQVFETYLDDFHGRTVEFYQRYDPANESNKAVCFDCHGIHNIRSVEDPLATVYPENLQDTCQQCHEDASIRFPQSWLGHYPPTWEDTPVVFAVNTAYTGLLPLTIGGFLFYIGLDVRKRWSDRRKMVRKALKEEEDDDILKLEL